MKKLIFVTLGLFLVLIVCSNLVSAQPAQKGKEEGKPIPSEVLKITTKSCGSCHAEPGNFMALPHVNLSKWNSYSPEKQAAKSQAMCDELTKTQMPPKKFRKKHPEAIPTPAEIKMICDWAQSLQMTKK